MYDEEGSEGPKGTFEIYKAEADTLYKQGEYRKSIESYTTALELQPGDKNCLVCRSKCYLQLGDTENALHLYNLFLIIFQGIYQKAQALYYQGDFEMALVFYHRGHKLRPELQEFRLGIQKAQEAIDNSVGSPDTVKLTTDGDLTFFDKQDDKKLKKKSGGGFGSYGGRPAQQQPTGRLLRTINMARSPGNEKTIKQLLGELYGDRTYLERLLKETDPQSDMGKTISNLVAEGLSYLDTRTDFWRQQKPMYARKHERIVQRRRQESHTGKLSPNDYIIRELERIDDAQVDGRYQESLKRAQRCLSTVQGFTEEQVPNKLEVIANLHSCIGNAYLEMGFFEKSLENHQIDFDMGEQHDMEDACSRGLDNLGRVHARQGDYEKAIDVWEKKLPMSKSPLESTWLYHEIGRCYLELSKYETAKDYGEKSQNAAEEAEDLMWQLQATVMYQQKQQLKKAIDEVNNKIIKGSMKSRENLANDTGNENNNNGNDTTRTQMQEVIKEEEREEREQQKNQEQNSNNNTEGTCMYNVCERERERERERETKMYDEEGSEGPKGTFEIYKAEADTLYKQGEYRKSIESYTTALELQPGDKNCLGIYQKAQALYYQGDFEMALVFYHRGHKLRPELQEFRLGIQKAQEAIDNSVGSPDTVKLTTDGDLTFFDKQDDKKLKKKSGGGFGSYGGRPAQQQPTGRLLRTINMARSPGNEKTIKQLLGELYGDRTYLERLLKETDPQSDMGKTISNLVAEGLSYLDTRTDFWRQQKPMYARKHERIVQRRRQESHTGKLSPNDYIIRELERIDDAQVDGRYQESLKRAQRCLSTVQGFTEEQVPNKLEVIANLHSCIGNAYLEMGFFEKSLENHQIDFDMGEQHDMEDACSRGLDNLGRVHARQGDYEKAIDVWEKKLPMSKSPLESTWLYHEIGRCYLELSKYETAKDYGEKSQNAAEEAEDLMWQLQATVLVAQSEVKLGDLQGAVNSFEKGLDLAKQQGDVSAETAIKKAIDEVNNKIIKGSMKSRENLANDTGNENNNNGNDTTRTQMQEILLVLSCLHFTTSVYLGLLYKVYCSDVK
ncbi:hypothetical protein KUTeg_015104 [Tegillarca granosa]|uniref:Outer dynein arm-docking complex subunit 4 n=1 Tax=Tegillarca granosa TaxID=220873 RepID=A0ABQ9EUE1_TEGGR|nr:hypothetical protein KUTeg_015104 [Tegillarca granosa]